jgi:hypothetical protein
MANLLSLPFDAKLLIVRYLNLRDCHLLKYQPYAMICDPLQEKGPFAIFC